MKHPVHGISRYNTKRWCGVKAGSGRATKNKEAVTRKRCIKIMETIKR